MIGMALLNYHQDYGCFPPVYTEDHNGKPMHSWRVLLLPYIDEELYSHYNLAEPWNSPANRKLAPLMPGCYRCPAERSNCISITNYLAVVGHNASWREGKSLRFSDFSDSANSPILLVEVADSDINWMEPRDLKYHEAIAGVNGSQKPCISSHHGQGANCILADFNTKWLENDTSLTSLKELLVIAGKANNESH